MDRLSESASLRRFMYVVLIVVAVAGISGRILSVARVYEPWLFKPSKWPRERPEPLPLFGSNDCSRWATARALVEDGTYVIGQRNWNLTLCSAALPLAATDPFQTVALLASGYDARVRSDSGIIFENGWRSVDKVLNPATLQYYSSKPPLLATLVAGEYWLLHHGLGWKITDEVGRWVVVRTILLTINALPWVLYLILLARVAERHGTSDWGRLYMLTAACFGTFMTPFAITLNNHTVAACLAMFAIYPALGIWSWNSESGATVTGEPRRSSPPWYSFLLAGFFGGFAACTDLPAASFAAVLFLLLLWQAPVRTLALFLPAAVIPVAAFFWTNYLALGQLRPAYSEFGGPWYEFEGSHWLNTRRSLAGIDAAGFKEDRAVYAFHMLLGHHGVFALTPIFLFSVVGMAFGVRFMARKQSRAEDPTDLQRGQGFVSLLAVMVSLIVMGFYLLCLDQGKRNYAGFTSGPRWMIWLTPLWLITLLPVADWLGRRRWGRVLAYVFLAFSVLSVSYPAWNPWRHPWLYNWLEALGVISY